MQMELKIKEILGGVGSVEKKVKEIQQFMNWEEKKLTEAILRHGTNSNSQQNSVIKEFWGKAKL